MPITPDQVSTVTGNQVLSAIKNTLAPKLEGKINRHSGSSAVDGTGPSRRNTGCTQ